MRNEVRIIFTVCLAVMPTFGLCCVYGNWMNVNMEPGVDPLTKYFVTMHVLVAYLLTVSTLIKASYLPLRCNFVGSFSPCWRPRHLCSSSSSATDSFSVCMNCNRRLKCSDCYTCLKTENRGCRGTSVCTGSLIRKWLKFDVLFF
jgi:hypothetical protein